MLAIVLLDSQRQGTQEANFGRRLPRAVSLDAAEVDRAFDEMDFCAYSMLRASEQWT